MLPSYHALSAVSGFPDILLVLVLAVLSLALIFAGRRVTRAIALALVGLIGASVGSSLGLTYLGPAGGIAGAVLGFVLGGLLGLMLLAVGVGVAFGYLGYFVAYTVFSSAIVALAAGALLFIVGLVLSGRVLTLAGAFLGGLLLLDVLLSFGVGFQLGAAVAAVAALAGLVVQSHRGKAGDVSPQGVGTPRAREA